MKKKKVLVLLILVFLCVLYFLYSQKINFEIVEYELEGKKYKLYLADTPKKREFGLMYRKELKDVDGMLFVFPSKLKPVFYNKNTYLDLDLYWIDGSSIIAKNFLPSIKETKIIVYVSPPKEVDKVVELIRKK